MTLSRALGIGLAAFFALYGAAHLAIADGPLAVSGGGTGASSFATGSILFMGSSAVSQNNANLFWDDLNQRLGLGTTTPTRTLEFGVNKGLQLSTDIGTHNVTGLIRLQSLTDEAKATIAYLDKTGHEVIWLQAHDYLTYPNNRHKHFSIEASDAAGLKQTRLGVGYGADVVDVTVNQADLIVNRNNGMKNGNIVMTGLGGGGMLKHKNSFALYPNYATNSTYALQVGLTNPNQITLRTLGADTLHVDDTLVTTGKVGVGVLPSAWLHLKAGSTTPGSAPMKLSAGPLQLLPEDGAFEYDGTNFYFTIGSIRRQLNQQTSNTLTRTAVADTDYTLLPTDVLVAYTALTAGRTVTLPSPEAAANKVFIIKDEAGSAGSNHIAINGSVDGTTTKAIAVDYGSLELYSTGSAWFTK